MKQKTNLTLPLIITAALLFYIFTSATMQIVDINKTGFHNEKETYTILEPYNETEYYMEKVPYGNLVNCNPAYMKFTEEFSRARKITEDKIYFVCILKVTNNDVIAENWTYYAKFTKEDGYQFDDSDLTKEILPGQTAVFEWSYLMKEPNATVNCEYKPKELPKTIVCRSSFYKEVNATRTITKYRNITQTRDVEKYDLTQTQEPAYFNRFFNYRQFFYLGY
jgi:hypothetical protein